MAQNQAELGLLFRRFTPLGKAVSIAESVYEMSKSNADHLKGGKQNQRDKTFGIGDKNFWDWWHNGGGKDGKDATPKDYQIWKELGRPRGPMGNKPWKNY